jgi:hypothetical protein
MWIRSQKKQSLFKCLVFSAEGKKIYGAFGSGENGNGLIGEYETHERAVEVLDDIQLRLIKGIKYDDIINGRRIAGEYVYQMPEK